MSKKIFNNAHAQTNTFQCLITANNESSYVYFLYKQGGIQWTTGNSNGGTQGMYNHFHHVAVASSLLCALMKGLGGNPATIGLNAGDMVNYLTVMGSNTPDVINISSTTNTDMPGVWVFQVNQFQQYGIHLQKNFMLFSLLS